MDKPVTWSPEALEDIEAIAEYIARDSAFYASAVVTKLLSVAADIASSPLAGRIVPELADAALRERFVYSYRLIYRLEDNGGILIVAVIHGRRLLNKRLTSDGQAPTARNNEQQISNNEK